MTGLNDNYDLVEHRRSAAVASILALCREEVAPLLQEVADHTPSAEREELYGGLAAKLLSLCETAERLAR